MCDTAPNSSRCIVFSSKLSLHITFNVYCLRYRSMLRVQQKISDGLRVLQYFTMRKWDFTNDRLLALRESMNDVDRHEFNMDFEKMDINDYFKKCILGARQYCLREDPATIPRARKTLKV